MIKRIAFLLLTAFLLLPAEASAGTLPANGSFEKAIRSSWESECATLLRTDLQVYDGIYACLIETRGQAGCLLYTSVQDVPQGAYCLTAAVCTASRDKTASVILGLTDTAGAKYESTPVLLTQEYRIVTLSAPLLQGSVRIYLRTEDQTDAVVLADAIVFTGTTERTQTDLPGATFTPVPTVILTAMPTPEETLLILTEVPFETDNDDLVFGTELPLPTEMPLPTASPASECYTATAAPTEKAVVLGKKASKDSNFYVYGTAAVAFCAACTGAYLLFRQRRKK